MAVSLVAVWFIVLVEPTDSHEVTEESTGHDSGQSPVVELEDISTPSIGSTENQPGTLMNAAFEWSNFLAEHPHGVSDISDDEMEQLHNIAVARVEEEGIEAFNAISESLTDGDIRLDVLYHVVERIGHSNPQLAFDVAMLGDESSSMVWNIAQEWAASDPKSALNHVTQVADSALRREMQEVVIRRWAAGDPEAIIGNVEQVPEELRDLARYEALSSWAGSAPRKAALMIGSVNNVESRRKTATVIARKWLRRNVSDALDWVQMNPELEEVRFDVLAGVLGDLAEKDLEMAFRTAVGHPVHQESSIGLEAIVLGRVANNNLDEALNLLKEVRSGPTKHAAITSLGSALARNDEMAKAMALSSQLPEANRNVYTTTVAVMWAIAQPLPMVAKQLNILPTDELKTQISLMVLSRDRMENELSRDQVEELKSRLTEEQLEALEQIGHTVVPTF